MPRKRKPRPFHSGQHDGPANLYGTGYVSHGVIDHGLPRVQLSAKGIRKARAKADTSVAIAVDTVARPQSMGSGVAVVGVVKKYKRQELATTIARKSSPDTDASPGVAVERDTVDRAMGVVRLEVPQGRRTITRVDRTTDLDDEAPLPTLRVAVLLATGRVKHVLLPGRGAPTRCKKDSAGMDVFPAASAPFWLPSAWCKACTR
jgi:hypothetical protein